jgi:hypothetical protein
MLAVPGDTNWEVCGRSDNLPGPQVAKFTVANINFQYTKTGIFCRESSPNTDKWSLYKILQLVFLSLAGDQAQKCEHVSECLATDLYSQYSISTHSLNIENISTERLQLLKNIHQWLSLRCVNSKAHMQEIWKNKATWLLQNSTPHSTKH